MLSSLLSEDVETLDTKDFVVQIRHRHSGGLEVHVLQSPACGETSGPFVLNSKLKEMLARPGGLRWITSCPRASSQRELDALEETSALLSAEVVGTALFDSLFPPTVRSLFDQSYGALTGGKSGLRIKLRFDLRDPELARLHALPWELLCIPGTKRFLCLDPRLPVVRYLEAPTGVALMALPSPLRILVVMASLDGLSPLNVVKERQLLATALRNHNEIESHVLVDPDTSGLHDRLAEGPWHVLHFMGHGGFDENAEIGVLCLVDQQRKPQPLSGVALARLLRTLLPDLRLVVLNACSTALTATPSGLDPFGGVAAALVEVGLPAVLAMQTPISDQAAISFSRSFYRHLAAGDPVDVAAAHGRLEIYLSDQFSAEWATPVLFMRVPDGQIFLPPQEANTARPLDDRVFEIEAQSTDKERLPGEDREVPPERESRAGKAEHHLPVWVEKWLGWRAASLPVGEIVFKLLGGGGALYSGIFVGLLVRVLFGRGQADPLGLFVLYAGLSVPLSAVAWTSARRLSALRIPWIVLAVVGAVYVFFLPAPSM